MKVFVATKQTQGYRKNDFSFVPEDELVYIGALECDGETVDGHCGCKRSVTGMVSLKSTTTFKIADLPITEKEYIAKFLESQKTAGWLRDGEDSKMFSDLAKALLHDANLFPVGSILEKRGKKLRTRVLT